MKAKIRVFKLDEDYGEMIEYSGELRTDKMADGELATTLHNDVYGDLPVIMKVYDSTPYSWCEAQYYGNWHDVVRDVKAMIVQFSS